MSSGRATGFRGDAAISRRAHAVESSAPEDVSDRSTLALDTRDVAPRPAALTFAQAGPYKPRRLRVPRTGAWIEGSR